jgi:hypothetical protein
MRTKQDLFTINYAIEFDSWVKIETEENNQGFTQTYTKTTTANVYTININPVIFYNLLKINDQNNKLIFFGYVRNLYDYGKLKKKLK